jgi:hypothetical protein
LIVPSANDAEISAIQLGDILNFSGSNLRASDLRAIGLALMMTSECGALLATAAGQGHCRSCTSTPFLPEQIQSKSNFSLIDCLANHTL